jgi:hypothetical protein
MAFINESCLLDEITTELTFKDVCQSTYWEDRAGDARAASATPRHQVGSERWVCVRVCVCLRVCVCVFMCVCVCLCVGGCVCTHIHACIHECMHTYIRTCIYACVYMHTYMHT